MRILVTGAHGQLGNELRCIENRYPQLRFLFHDVDTLDICNPDQLDVFFAKEQPQWVINCAAYTAVDKAETDADTAFLVNARAVKNIAEAAKKSNAKIIHVSTDYVFDGKSYMPYTEDMPTNPLSVYGKSKLEGELALIGNNNAIIIRTSWLYSSFGNNFVKTMLRLGNEREQVNVISDQAGTPTYAADLAHAIMQIIVAKQFVAGIFHYSNEGICSWYDFACEIMAQANRKCKVLPIPTTSYPTPAQRPIHSTLNKKKIKETYNIEIPWWKDSLTNCIKILQEK